MRDVVIKICLCLLCALFIGYWFGEHAGAVLPMWDLVVLIVLSCVAYLCCRNSQRHVKLTATLSCAIIYSFSWYLGSSMMQNAYNECVHNGEDVRQYLATFHQKNGHFPETLAQLNVKHLPCQRVFPPQLLHYKTTATGYDLYFGDSFTSNTATESSPFFAHK